jgi:hypothetical protein
MLGGGLDLVLDKTGLRATATAASRRMRCGGLMTVFRSMSLQCSSKWNTDAVAWIMLVVRSVHTWPSDAIGPGTYGRPC